MDRDNGIVYRYKGLGNRYSRLVDRDNGILDPYKGLGDRYNRLVDRDNEIVDRYKGLGDRYNRLVDRYNGLLDRHNGLKKCPQCTVLMASLEALFVLCLCALDLVDYARWFPIHIRHENTL